MHGILLDVLKHPHGNCAQPRLGHPHLEGGTTLGDSDHVGRVDQGVRVGQVERISNAVGPGQIQQPGGDGRRLVRREHALDEPLAVLGGAVGVVAAVLAVEEVLANLAG